MFVVHSNGGLYRSDADGGPADYLERIGSDKRMAIDSQRRAAIVEALKASQLQAVASSSPQEVLLLTGYRPVMGASLALVTRDGEVCALIRKMSWIWRAPLRVRTLLLISLTLTAL